MIQLQILSGQLAGELRFVRQFPFHIGRAAENDLPLDDPGVWDKHLTIDFDKTEGFTLETAPETFCTVNEASQSFVRLRNGDILSFGSARIQFWLAPPKQRGLRLRELFVWLLLVLVTLGQFALIYALLPAR
jgi:pSer/pThr/pTyr-binding forkhead associated (FHA) protein